MTSTKRKEWLLRLGCLKQEVRELEERLDIEPEEAAPTLPAGARAEVLGLIADFAADLLSVHEAQGDYVWVSKNCESLFGWKEEDLLGRSAYELFHPEDLPRIAEDHARHGEGTPGLVRYRLRCGSGGYRWVETRSRASADGRWIVAITRDVHAEQELLETLERRAFHDVVTNLPNRYALEESLHQELARSQRSHEPLSILTFDIDGFKAINDAHGHAAGDAHLRDIAQCITAARRAYDVAGRWGGDEFLVILPETTAKEAAGVAERLRQAVADLGAGTTLSFGVASTASASDIRGLLAQADKALYRAKGLGGDRVEIAEAGRDDYDGSQSIRELVVQ